MARYIGGIFEHVLSTADSAHGSYLVMREKLRSGGEPPLIYAPQTEIAETTETTPAEAGGPSSWLDECVEVQYGQVIDALTVSQAATAATVDVPTTEATKAHISS